MRHFWSRVYWTWVSLVHKIIGRSTYFYGSVVDQAMEVVEEYQHKILKLEHDVLIKPSMKSVRYRMSRLVCD